MIITRHSKSSVTQAAACYRARTVRQLLLPLLLIGVLSGSATACDSRAGESDIEEERTNLLILDLATNAALTDFLSTCQLATAAGLQCATSAGSDALYGSSFLTPSFGIASTAGASASTLCASTGSNYPGAGVLASYTNAARVCWFQCEQTYWADIQGQGKCSASGYSAAGAAAFTIINACSEICRTTGTFFPF